MYGNMHENAKAKEKKNEMKSVRCCADAHKYFGLCLCVPICAQSSQCVQVLFFSFQVEVYGYRRKEREKKSN